MSSFSDGRCEGGHRSIGAGMDVYLLTDVGNYNCTYSMFGQPVPMSPDDHYQDLKRAIEAVGGKAHRITVIMPILYGGRQHRRTSRESLDCAVALQEATQYGRSFHHHL
ncbi:MAG: ribose-phosphate pyrophosphokinase-like domain-containing protein [Clostridia bacterium]